MEDENITDTEEGKEEKHGLKEKISGLGQFIIGEIETLGGVLTGDPTTQAEGEFNVEVGTVREEIKDELEEEEGLGSTEIKEN
ncbi:MAG TPA: hypothetical protein VL327_04825 [Pyrinomonadaceae bacterium]|jgi:hypothetical protein|nr:hypothetical protein [Pyrinomonadaceae bacterium]